MTDAATDMVPLLEVRGLGVEFQTRGGTAHVLEDIQLHIQRGETLGLVGESGCGKSITALALMRLIPQPPGRITSGQILFDGQDLLQLPEAQMRRVRGNRISMIFQEPMTSLNPAYSVGDQITESVRLHQGLNAKDGLARAVEMLEAVGIPDALRRVHEYPHQFSGGMRQRVMIAMALACQPDLLIADEPTTALDVTVQAQIFDLIRDLRERSGTAVLLITHDMGAVAEMTDRVAVMYAGRMVEEGPTDVVLSNPCHPYTQGLIACAPGRSPQSHGKPLQEIPGTVPSLLERKGGCTFADRCSQAQPRCRTSLPPSTWVQSGHRVMCWLYPEGNQHA
jgi:peptide/nickel transport system ATP-binding protein